MDKIILKDNEEKAVLKLKEVLTERFKLLDFRVFGSKARGEALPDSDIDVMIEIDEYSPEIESAIDDLVYEPYSSSKHSGVLSYFNRRFVTGGIFGENLGRSINKAFELRQRGDYREYFELTYEQVEPYIPEAEIFINAVKNYLQKITKPAAEQNEH